VRTMRSSLSANRGAHSLKPLKPLIVLGDDLVRAARTTRGSTFSERVDACAAEKTEQCRCVTRTRLGAMSDPMRLAQSGVSAAGHDRPRRAWAIIGSRGTIHTFGDGQTWVVFVACRSPVHWTYTKRRLAFCALSQDGEDEGILRLHRLPTNAEATIIRHVLGLRKRMEIAPKDLERRRASMTRLGAAKISASTTSCVPEPTPTPSPILEPALTK